jgi:glycerate 2-kinase
MFMDIFKAADQIIKTALEAGDPAGSVEGYFTIEGTHLVDKTTNTSFSLTEGNIIIVGAGKATAPMAQKMEEMILPVSTSLTGIISVKEGHGESLEYINVVEAAHPVPDERGMKAAQGILDLLEKARAKDLVIALFSGGGSALLPLPVPGISLADMQQTTDLLLASGAEIDEMNAVRKHISRVKGGNLMRAAYPARVCTLLLSDVVGNKVDVIASGPFVPDNSTFSGAVAVLKKYEIFDRIPAAVRDYLVKGDAGRIPETPKQDDPVFTKNHTRIIGSNRQCLDAAKKKAEKLGFHTLILSSRVKGEAREFGKILAAIAGEIRDSGNPVPPPGCVLWGGETTVTIKGPGKGGRNQECVLGAVKEIKGMENVLIYCIGTDGTDGPTDAAGAWCSGTTEEKGNRLGMMSSGYLAANDSYHYFKKTGNLVITGPTKTNVMDIYMVLVV